MFTKLFTQKRIKSLLLDSIQLISLIFLAISGPLISSNLAVIFMQIAAIIILILAVWEMRHNKFYRVPDIEVSIKRSL